MPEVTRRKRRVSSHKKELLARRLSLALEVELSKVLGVREGDVRVMVDPDSFPDYPPPGLDEALKRPPVEGKDSSKA